MCCMDVCVTIVEEGERGNQETEKAQVSTTCVPWVLMIFTVWPARRGVAMPLRAGIVLSWEDIVTFAEMFEGKV